MIIRLLTRLVYIVLSTAGIAIILGPLLILFPVSFTAGSTYQVPSPEGYSLRWFERLFELNPFGSAIWLSVRVALVATVISLVLGVLAAYGLSRVLPRWRIAGEAFFTMPLIFPSLIYGMAILLFLSRIGLLGSFTGLVIGHAVVTLPFTVRALLANTKDIQVLEDAAASLGASAWARFRRVTLPLLVPGIFAGGLFSFVVSLDDFSVSLFIIQGNKLTLPVAMYNAVELTVDPTIAAMSVLLVLFSAIFIAVIELTYGLKKFVGAR